MAVPRSFAAFQKLFEDIPVNPDQPQDSGPPEPAPEEDPKRFRRQKLLGIATDAILADLHTKENLRDAVTGSIPNLKNGTLLFLINPSLETSEELVDFLSTHPRIKRFALGARKLKDGERIRAVKIKIVPVDDECTPPDEAAQKAKDQEQSDLKTQNTDSSGTPLTTAFAPKAGET